MSRLRCWFLSEYLVLSLSGLLFLALAPFAPGLATTASLLNLLAYLLPLLIAATGLTLVLISGGIDLSITSIIALTSVIGAQLMSSPGKFGATPLVGSLAMLGVGASLGWVNGALITFLRLPAFMVTLASMMFLSGFAIWWTQSKNISQLPPGFLSLGQSLPVTLAIALVLTVGTELLLRGTVFGHWLYAVGQNGTAAHISGVPVRRVTIAAYVASGFCAALASVILMARLETGSPVLGREILLDLIGATVVGGTSLFGGRGRITWTLFGVLFLTLLDQALNLMSLSEFSITIAKGTVILSAAVLDATRQRWARSSA